MGKPLSDPSVAATLTDTEKAGIIGILAGSGNLPLEIRQAIEARGGRTHVVAIAGSAEPGTRLTDGPHTWAGLGQINCMLGAFRQHGCRGIVIAGGVRRPDLRQVRPDLGFFTNLPAILRLMRGGDDRLLRKVIRFFEDQGFPVLGLTDLAPDLLAPAGPLGTHQPAADLQLSSATGRAAISALGVFDVGQAVLVHQGRLAAIEGADGTDALLGRATAATAGAVLVKMPKPGQDRRIDLPVIGPETIANAVRAGLAGIAIEAGGTIVIERDEVVRAADRAGLVVWGLDQEPGRTDDDRVDARRAFHEQAAVPLTRYLPSSQARLDAAIGLEAVRAAARFGPVTGAIVSREHVLAIGIAEAAHALIARATALKQWGDRKRRSRRKGVAVVADTGTSATAILTAAREAQLEAVVFERGVDGPEQIEQAAILQEADRAGLAVLRGI